MELSRVKILVDKYLNGETSRQEEEQLARYFSQLQEIPDELKPLKVMFASFETLSSAHAPKQDKTAVAQPKRRWLNISYRWTAGVAAAVCIAICASLFYGRGFNDNQQTVTEEPAIVCHIGGVKIDDSRIAYAETGRILTNVTKELQVAMEEVNRLTKYTTIR
jgi:hypothetical protein